MTLETKKQILRESKDLINRYIFDRTVVLAVHNEESILKHGTGMLLRIDGQPLVITAAHVIKDVDPETIQLITTESPSNIRCSPRGGDLYGGAESEDLDVGFLRIGDSALPLLERKKFLTLDDFDLFPTELGTDLAILFGMPGTEHIQLGDDFHSFRSLTFQTGFPSDLDWSSPGSRPILLGIDYAEEVEDVFTGQNVELPNPHGMSGGGLWRARYAGSVIWTPERLKLVGILTEFDEDRREIKANRVENLYHLLSHHFSLPEIQPAT